MRGDVVLGLGEQVGRDPVRIGVPVSNDQHLRGSGDHVDADFSEHEALGGGHVGVPRADHFEHRWDRLGTVREGRDCLRAADPENLVDARELGGREHERVELATGRRHAHDDALHAGDLGGHGIHQHRRRIGCRAPRNINSDRFDRRPSPRKLYSERIDEAFVARQLATVIGLDPVARECQRFERLSTAALGRVLDVLLADPDPERVEIDAI